MRFGMGETAEYELIGTIAIMHVTRTVVKVKKLSCLGHGTKQWIIAARAFLFFVETDGGALGVAFCGLYRTIEIKG
jgi:hypothetical protein